MVAGPLAIAGIAGINQTLDHHAVAVAGVAHFVGHRDGARQR